jgi:PAS domain-containing protein
MGVLVQRDEHIIYANRAALDCLGFADEGQILGRAVAELLDTESYATLASNFRKSRSDDDQLFMGELKLRRRNAGLIDAEVYHAGLVFEGAEATRA